MELDGQVITSSNVQSQAAVAAPQPVVAAPTGMVPARTVARWQFHWYHAVFGLGFLAASGAGSALLIKVSMTIPLLSRKLDFSYCQITCVWF